MGYIQKRAQKDGTLSFTAQIRRKVGGVTVYNLTQTFTSEATARDWMKRVEYEIAIGARKAQLKPASNTLHTVIENYVADMGKDIGKTKLQVLRAIQRKEISAKLCEDIDASALVAFARELRTDRQPQTVGNYMMHLSAVFSVAEVAYKAPLDAGEMSKALKTCRNIHVIKKSGTRKRRPELDELNRLMGHFLDRATRTNAAPMHRIVGFAITSTRRLGEITRLRWEDINRKERTILVRDMKHPGEKEGNDVRCAMSAKALRIIDAMPRVSPFIFPYNPKTLSKNFTEAVQYLQIDDLHFHDLRHEGCSLLAEKGLSIPQIAKFSGHRDWNSLQRYVEIEGDGTKLKKWKWWKALAEPESERRIRHLKRQILLTNHRTEKKQR